MDKLKMHTPDLAEENYKKLAALFPDAVTETKDENGNTVRAIDKDVLMQEINAKVVDDGQERYQFTWPDKRKAMVLANVPIAKTLRFEKEKSVGRDGTPGGTDSENIYIEGDNLDALKLLQETYLGKVKMIYIDPPYNTGNDFIYEDDFSQKAEDYAENSGQTDEEGNRLVQNSESNGRFHTDWLNMLYPRLKLAKDLLADDGVIFISIDDNEQGNLKAICDEIYGRKNFVTTIHCQLSTTQGMKVKAAQEGNIVKNAEYILCYGKNGKKNIAHQPLYDIRKKYDEHYSLYLNQNGTIGHLKDLYDYRFPNDCNNKKAFSLSEAYEKSHEFAEIVRTHLAEIVRTDKISGVNLEKVLSQGRWKKVQRNGKVYILTLDKNNNIKQLLRLKDSWGKTDGFYEEEGLRKIRGDWWEGFYIDMGNVSKEGDVAFANGKKPVRLIKQLAKMVTCDRDLILDFFSGSATTAHGVMQLNAEDRGNRKYIMIQLPVDLDKAVKKADSQAQKTISDAIKFLDSIEEGHNICNLGEERIRRAGKKIKEETGADIDYGFRCFRVDSSNMKDVYYKPSDVKQAELDLFTDNIKEDRTPEDLLIQVMLDLGVLLSSKVEEEEIAGKKVFSVADGYLIACFDRDVTDDVVTAIARKHPFYAVFRDSSFSSDSVAANFEQIFDTYSPQTVRKVL